MESYLKKDNIFCIIPEDFDNASYVKFAKYDDNHLSFITENKENFNIGDTVELFSNGKKGILYFNSRIKEYYNNILETEKPVDYDIIQRRENERIYVKANIIIKNNLGNKIRATIVDLSVGGMKIECNEELRLNEKYYVKLNFDNLNLEFLFIPSRQSVEDNIYTISGKINSTHSTDKIELVQYCYKKQFEQSNRN